MESPLREKREEATLKKEASGLVEGVVSLAPNSELDFAASSP